jgi:hypothetical protein
MVNSEMSVMIDAADETSVRRVDVTMSHPPLLTVIARNPNRRRANFSKPRNARIPSVQRVAASFGALDPIADGFQLGGKREYVGTYLRGLWVVEQIQAHGIRFGKKSSIVDGKQQDKTDSDVLSSRQRIENVRRYK